MTRPSTPPILHQLQNAESLSSQIAALRTLKNETIGHDQHKENWIRGGVIPILSRILTARLPSGKAAAEIELNGSGGGPPPPGVGPQEEEACIQAVIVVGSLAQGT